MTPFTQPHTLSSLLTVYVCEDEGVETLNTAVHAAARAVIQLGNHPKVEEGQGCVRKGIVAPKIPASLCEFVNCQPQI